MAAQPKVPPPDALSQEALEAFDNLNGHHPGFRPVHAKGILLSGAFIPSPQAASLTRAPHLHNPSTRIVVRFSDFAGLPSVADNDAENAGPRGLAIRFYFSEHVHTDIIAHSVDGFAVRTAEEFVEFLRAIYASGPGATKPTPVESFLGTHPAALAFVQTPKPIPTSLVKESYFAVNAYKFINRDGIAKFGRYRILPEDKNQYLDEAGAAKKSPDFLFDEIRERVGKGGTRMRILVQVAAEGDAVDDSTVHWPDQRPVVEFGTIELNSVVPDGDAEQRHIIFDPLPRVDGIESSGDPLLEPRAAVYLMSGRRRRALA
ncbi:MAG TPA: catalase family peroxidase [Terriglobales bacterium]|nr:catalase family peroxidase [Terriglobales bacterium]